MHMMRPTSSNGVNPNVPPPRPTERTCGQKTGAPLLAHPRDSWFAVWLPATHPLRVQLDDENRRGQAGRFGVEENPRCFHWVWREFYFENFNFESWTQRSAS